MREYWKPIKGLEGKYEVSNHGRTRNVVTTKVKTYGPDKHYPIAVFKNNGKWVKRYVHRLVLESFTEKPDWATEVNHVDGVKHNNRIDNLEWSTTSKNQIHAHAAGLSRPANRKISYRERAIIRKLRQHSVPFKVIAEAFGVSNSLIEKIVYMNSDLRDDRSIGSE